jgi:hypothetical protein
MFRPCFHCRAAPPEQIMLFVLFLQRGYVAGVREKIIKFPYVPVRRATAYPADKIYHLISSRGTPLQLAALLRQRRNLSVENTSNLILLQRSSPANLRSD